MDAINTPIFEQITMTIRRYVNLHFLSLVIIFYLYLLFIFQIITTKNMMNEIFKFIYRNLLPAIVPPDWVLTYMMQSGEYIFSSDIVMMNYHKMNYEEARILINIAFFPEMVDVSMIRRLVFNPASFTMSVSLQCIFLELLFDRSIIMLYIDNRDWKIFHGSRTTKTSPRYYVGIYL
jgi:hypothetical protein